MCVDIIYGDEQSGEEVAVVDGRQPGGFSWEPCGAVEVSDGTSDALELVDIVYGFVCVGSFQVIVEELDVVEHLCGRRYVVHGVEGVMTGGAVKEEGVGVLVLSDDVR